jgi:hypothetical protein
MMNAARACLQALQPQFAPPAALTNWINHTINHLPPNKIEP